MITPANIACIIVSIGIAFACFPLWKLRKVTQSTTLRTAWFWVIVAAVLWILAWVLDSMLRSVTAATADHLWYASAVVALCPAISVLGSRRPGTRVWTWFIQVPMLFVLGWPVIALWLQGHEVRGLQLETPQLAAYLLVLLMGAGNYLGTRLTLPSLCYAMATGILAVSSSAACPQLLSDRWWARVWATGLMVLAILMTARGNRIVAPSRLDQIWIDFFDQFGIVWGRRIQDRVNFIAEKEKWPTRLELDGFHWDAAADPTTESRIEHTFRWLLRRFVDPDWIDVRLGTQQSESEVTALAADS